MIRDHSLPQPWVAFHVKRSIKIVGFPPLYADQKAEPAGCHRSGEADDGKGENDERPDRWRPMRLS